MKLLKALSLIIALLFSGLAHADITSNLAVWWKFDDNTGTTATDSSGNSRNGTLTGDSGTPAWATPGQASSTAYLDFTRANVHRVNFSGNAGITNYPLTLAAWFRTSDTTNAQYLVGIGDLGGESEAAIRLVSGTVQIVVKDSGANQNTAASASYSSNTWTHACATIDSGSGNLKLYINGSADGTGNGNQTLSGFDNTRAGADPNSEVNALDGDLDEVRIYSRALSSGDCAELYAYSAAAPSRLMRRGSMY